MKQSRYKAAELDFPRVVQITPANPGIMARFKTEVAEGVFEEYTCPVVCWALVEDMMTAEEYGFDNDIITQSINGCILPLALSIIKIIGVDEMDTFIGYEAPK